jgi:hypothetical protein
MANERLGRRPSGRRWAFSGRRKLSRRAGNSPWYPQAQTVIEAGPVVTVPLAVDEPRPPASLVGTLLAWLILTGDGRDFHVPSALAVSFGGPDLAPALIGESA